MLWSKLGVTAVMQLALGWVLGLMLIPVFRRMKTGKYSPYIGDRFRTDGSEPAFGGVNALIVYAFGCFVAAAFCESGGRLIAAAVFAAVAALPGVLDDHLLDRLGKNAGVRTKIKLGYTFAACLVYAAAARRLGYAGTELILPFRLGIIPLGIAYVPVSAAVMTLIIYSFRVMNRFGTDEETCIGGLSYAVGAVGALGLSAAGTAVRSDEITALGLVTAAALMSGLFFGLAPAKHRSGSSGGSFTGAAAAAGLVLTENLQLCVVFAAAAAFIDALCAAVQFLRYRRTKRLWLMGTSLHHHLKNKMYGEYAVIGVFAVITLTADAAAVWYAVYLYKSYL